ncbi:hypothetical protein [Neobacillus sp. D3-1R]|uniref:hypothetical protein n=1 Tax=Neobacillus sp. D3-1R TaxID=3445778 RepID=UPI003F9FD001
MSSSTILPYGPGPGQWDTIRELLQSAANWDFANGQKMTINGTVCGNVANASSVQGNGNYSNTGTVGGIQWVGPTGPIHSTYTSQDFDCQWFTPGDNPPGCPVPPNEPSDQLFVDIATASNTAKSLASTQTFAGIDTNAGNVTINVVSGLNVINVPPNPFGTTEGKIQVRGNGDLIISGPSDAVVIFNVGADNEVNAVRNGMDILNGRSILTQGGVQAQNILFNVLGGDITINGGTVNGNFLVRAGSDVKGKADIQGTTQINGIVIGDGNHSSEFSLAENATICGQFAPEPLIDIEKLVSVDGGLTFVDADVPPGPVLNVTTQPNVHFKYVISNIGGEDLENIVVTDDVYGNITLPQTTLAVGESMEVETIEPGVLGQHTNIATVTGNGVDSGTEVTDSDAANYVGAEQNISIDLVKEVSPDGGSTWFDANEAPGPVVVSPQAPRFRYTVTNTGDETLVNVTITDSALGLIVVIGQLDPGETDVHFRTGSACSSPGQQSNIAFVTATGQDSGIEVTDSDPAFWFCIQGQPNPSINIQKLVSVDNGETYVDANTSPGPLLPPGVTPQFKLVVTNTGNVPLQNVTVTDSDFGLITIIPLMDPGEVQEIFFP